MRIELTDEDDHFGRYWVIKDDRVVYPHTHGLPKDWGPSHVQVALCNSRKIAARIVELIKDDETLRQLLVAYVNNQDETDADEQDEQPSLPGEPKSDVQFGPDMTIRE